MGGGCLAVSLLDYEGTEERTPGRTDGSAAADVRIPYSGEGEREGVGGNEKLGKRQSTVISFSASFSLFLSLPSSPIAPLRHSSH